MADPTQRSARPPLRPRTARAMTVVRCRPCARGSRPPRKPGTGCATASDLRHGAQGPLEDCHNTSRRLETLLALAMDLSGLRWRTCPRAKLIVRTAAIRFPVR